MGNNKAQLEELNRSTVIQPFRANLSNLRRRGQFNLNLDQLKQAMEKWFSDGGVELRQPNGVFVSANELVIMATYPELLQASRKASSLAENGDSQPTSRTAAQGEELSPLLLRTFKVNWRAFTNGLYAETRATDLSSAHGVLAAFNQVLTNRGIVLTNVFCNPRGEAVMMRGTASNLEAAEKLLNELTRVPSQVNIRVKFLSVPENRLGELLGIIGETNTVPAQSLSAIVAEPYFESKMRTLETIPDVMILGEGNVTTLSGRQAQIQRLEMKTILREINPKALTAPGIVSSNGTIDLFRTEAFPVGSSLDIIPIVSEDEQIVSLRATASLVEFQGYQKGSNVVAYVDGKRTKVQVPGLIKYRRREASADAIVWDGQTLVLIGKSIGVEVTGETRERHVRLITFVTATLIDAAGNRVNPAK